MGRFKCTISYDGTEFAGYQVQPGKRTVQSELEEALSLMHKGEEVKIIGSGRTDSGVHAVGQVIHFDSPYTFPLARWEKALNTILSSDLLIVSMEHAEADFHARFNTTGKEYRYMISRGKKHNPFERNYKYHYPYPLDIAAIKEAIPHLIGTHDYTSFCSARTEVVDKVRTIEVIELLEEGETLTFRFVGEGFLYKMVRILVGTLLEVGAGKKKPSDIPVILGKKDRSEAGRTAPGHGLYLWEVHY